jgi:hypothetical protein
MSETRCRCGTVYSMLKANKKSVVTVSLTQSFKRVRTGVKLFTTIVKKKGKSVRDKHQACNISAHIYFATV